jgi:hypothetical protein
VNKLVLHTLVFLIIGYHPLHISFTSLDINREAALGILSVKVFSDDFADRLGLDHANFALMENDTLTMKDKAIFLPYLAENLQIRLDGELKALYHWSLDSIKNNFEASWLYFSLELNQVVKEVSVRNTIFFDVFNDQKNLLILSNDGIEKAYQLSRKKPVITVRY